MPKLSPVIVGYELLTGFGAGIGPIWKAILCSKNNINNISRFSVKNFQAQKGSCIPGLSYHKGKSLSLQMLEKVFSKKNKEIPPEADLILATTVGEIDKLEINVTKSTPNLSESMLANLLDKIKGLSEVHGQAEIVSSACASASSAVAVACAKILSGNKDCVLVVATDSLTEFVYSGFASLMALDKHRASPFDRKRSGLSLGEAAGFILLMSAERAERERRPVYAQINGFGLSCDANHMTGPSRDGSGLSIAIKKALGMAGLKSGDIGCISAHGTGTLYNDSMEIMAFKRVFGASFVPVYSIKGSIGHTLGAAGLVETIIALKVLENGVVPATVGLKNPDNNAKGWVSVKKRKLRKGTVLLNNCGFGGINVALILSRKNL